jgi:hypothetical protein
LLYALLIADHLEARHLCNNFLKKGIRFKLNFKSFFILLTIRFFFAFIYVEIFGTWLKCSDMKFEEMIALANEIGVARRRKRTDMCNDLEQKLKELKKMKPNKKEKIIIEEREEKNTQSAEIINCEKLKVKEIIALANQHGFEIRRRKSKADMCQELNGLAPGDSQNGRIFVDSSLLSESVPTRPMNNPTNNSQKTYVDSSLLDDSPNLEPPNDIRDSTPKESINTSSNTSSNTSAKKKYKTKCSSEEDTMEMLEELYTDPKKVFSMLHEADYVHGSSSASLLAFTEYNQGKGSLVPTGELLAQGKVPFSGELFAGVNKENGVNRENLSVVCVKDILTALKYAIGGQHVNWNPEIGNKQLESYKKTLEDMPHIMDIYKKRLVEWNKLNAQEQKLVSDTFPVMYGIKLTTKRRQRRVNSQGAPGEVIIKHGVESADIVVVFVPENRMAEVKDLLTQYGHDHIYVESINTILQGFTSKGLRWFTKLRY